MPDLFNEKNGNNIFDNAVKDDAMDLSEFITTPTTQKPTVETSPIDSALSDNTPKSNKELSPLAAELNRKKNAQLGATVTRKEMEDGKERTVFRLFAHCRFLTLSASGPEYRARRRRSG